MVLSVPSQLCFFDLRESAQVSSVEHVHARPVPIDHHHERPAHILHRLVEWQPAAEVVEGRSDYDLAIAIAITIAIAVTTAITIAIIGLTVVLFDCSPHDARPGPDRASSAVPQRIRKPDGRMKMACHQMLREHGLLIWPGVSVKIANTIQDESRCRTHSDAHWDHVSQVAVVVSGNDVHANC